MKKWMFIIGSFVFAAGLTGCGTTNYAARGYAADDLYGSHDQVAIARKQQAKAEAEKAEAEARKAEWEARIAQAQAAAAENEYYGNPYDDVLADTYESAYARRLRGFESPTYRMPSSYYNFRYGSSFNYVTAYDPAFYNIVVSGDQVWVEPRYVTSMFGNWGGSVVYADPWYWGWNSWPYRPGSYGFSMGSWGWSFGWNNWYNPWYNPWYNSWYDPWWGPGWGPGHGHGHGHGHGGSYSPNIVKRPSPYTSPSGGRGFGSRPGSTTSFNRNPSRFETGLRGGTSSGNRNTGSSFNRGSSSGGNRGSAVRNNRGGSTSFNRGSSSTFDRNNSGSSSSFNRGNSNNSGSSPSFNRGNSGSSSSFNRGGSSSGSYGGGSSGGGGGSVGGRNAGGR